jgi:phenylacetic acid degradation protein paaN
MTETVSELFERHRDLLDGALAALRSRAYWSAFPEVPSGKIYGETARADGEAAFRARLGRPFDLDQPAAGAFAGDERSPYGLELGVQYPRIDVERTIAAARAAYDAWLDVPLRERAGLLLEALVRLNRRSFEMAYAVMHASGQGFVMAFQAGGPHAQDRALEALAVAYDMLSAIPRRAAWEKPQGKAEPLRLTKHYDVVGRGVALAIGCSTFPTWNSYPALFADLLTGNAVVVKPHPNAILPLALTVEVLREVLRDGGHDPNLVQLAADTPAAPLAKALALHPSVALIDYTGGTAFGEWLENNARQARIFTEKSGVNPVVVDSTVDDLDGLLKNLAFSLSLYSGQMCTTPRNIFVPRDGIRANGEAVSVDEFVRRLGAALEALTADADRAAEMLGAIASDATLARLEEAGASGAVAVPSRSLTHPQFPRARLRTPLVLRVRAEDEASYARECFGPIARVVETADRYEALERAASSARNHGAITALVYSNDHEYLARVRRAARTAGVALSENLTGNVFVNQSAAFSDYHVSGTNPSGNASLTDPAFVAGRFSVAERRASA